MDDSRVSKTKIYYGKARTKALLIFLLIILFAVTEYGTYSWQQHKIDRLNQQITDLTTQLGYTKKQNQQMNNIYTSKGGVTIKIYTPQSDSKIVSPLAVVGEVPGSWSFEASFPVQLKDSKGNIIAQAPAQVLGDWMTNQLVPFSAKLEFTSMESGTGTLILQKDNPSGLVKNDDTVSIPVKF